LRMQYGRSEESLESWQYVAFYQTSRDSSRSLH